MAVEVSLEARTACPQCLAVFRGGFLRCPRDGEPLHALQADPLIGTVLAERYQIEALIGEGGLGRVYRARHVRMSRQYAIKVPFGELAYDTKVRARFANEAEAASRLRHPNVVGVVDVGESEQGLLYLAMDLVDGIALAEELEQRGAMPAERVRRIARQIALGLEHAHERALIHRDLKPENIILERDADGLDEVRIVDFGIAILQDARGDKLTTEGIVLGTPHYMAPEQAINGAMDHRVDIFALGLITYEMLAGVLPFDGSPVEVARQNLSAEPPPIATRVPGLVFDPLLEALAFRMLQKRPADRPQHLREVISMLDLIEVDPARARGLLAAVGAIAAEVPVATAPPLAATGASTRAPPTLPAIAEVVARLHDRPATTERTDAPPARRRTMAVIVAVALLFALIGIWLATRGGDTPSRATAPADAAPDAPTAIASAAVDAGVADAAAVMPGALDAAPARLPVDAGPRRAPDAAVRALPVDAGVIRAPVDARPPVDAGPVAPPTKASLTALYERVGGALDQLNTARGSDATRPFKQRFDQIAYLDAVRNPDIRAEVMNQLRSLDRDIARALK